MNFSQNLRTLRKLKGLSQKEIAGKISINDVAYYNYENSKCRPSYETLIKLSDYYSISIDDLLRNKLELIIK